MASRSRKEYYSITVEELAKAHDPSGRAAFDRYLELKKAGVERPEIQYSPFHGYRVRDPLAIPPRD